MTCCFFSSLKTLLTCGGYRPHAQINVLNTAIYGRFSGDHLWPVLGVHRGLTLPEAAAALGISTNEVCRRRNEGSLAGFRYGVNKYLYEPPLARPCNNLAEGVAV